MNLIDRPWIPCRFAGEPAARDVSIREALARAPDIAGLSDPSPLVTVALHRLLIAILHRVFGPESPDDWGALWEAGKFDTGAIDAYLDTQGARFNLFDPEIPSTRRPDCRPEMPRASRS